MNRRQYLPGIRGLSIIAALIAGASAASADGTFLQLDLSSGTSSAVVTVARGPLSFGAVHSEYDGGAATRLSVLHAWPAENGVTVRIGPSLGVTERDGQAGDDPEIGVKSTIDRYATTSFGALYLLGEFDTIDRSWFLLAQASFGQSGITTEISAGGSDAYEDATLAVSKRLGDGPVSLRGGWRIESEEAFLGLSVNTF